jgi:hypothetical protein
LNRGLYNSIERTSVYLSLTEVRITTSDSNLVRLNRTILSTMQPRGGPARRLVQAGETQLAAKD